MPHLSTPEKSLILLIDPAGSHAAKLDLHIAQTLRASFALLEEATKILQIPRYFAYPANTSERDDWLSMPCEQNRKRVYGWPEGESPWANQELVTAIRDENPSNLFLGGFWLDDSLTFAALGALTAGFDTYVITDVSVARSAESRETSMERLIQSGVVPTTAHQAISEWMTEVRDTALRAELQQLISTSLS